MRVVCCHYSISYLYQYDDSVLLKKKLSNNIIVYENSDAFTQIKIIINDLLHLFKDQSNVVDMSEIKYINIFLLNNWQNKYKLSQTQVYSFNVNNQTQINKAFNKLYNQNCMKWINILISFLFLCFVVWCILSDNIQKDCVIVDIRILNKISMSDAYSIFLQKDIFAAVQDIKYILTVNCSAYFYQWCINSEHQHHLIVASHHRQKMFKIAVMSYCNMLTYIQ